jgi:hypothetical protein
MKKRSETFGLTLSNIPHINLRNEFARYYNALKDDDFIAQFEGAGRLIRTPYMIWSGMPDDLITIILQRAILGVESYLRTSVFIEVYERGLFENQNINLIKNPFGLRGKGTVDNFYHRLPSLIDKKYSLKLYNNELFLKTVIFYKEVRNPIFHGHNLSQRDIRGLKSVFDYLAEIYAWIDSWHDFSKIFNKAAIRRDKWSEARTES